MTDRLLEPLLGGVYAGSRDGCRSLQWPLSCSSVQRGGSLLGTPQPIARPRAGRSGVRRSAGGVSTLVDALADDLDGGAMMHPAEGAAVRALDPMVCGYDCHVGPRSTRDDHGGRGGLLTAPATANGRLLGLTRLGAGSSLACRTHR